MISSHHLLLVLSSSSSILILIIFTSVLSSSLILAQNNSTNTSTASTETSTTNSSSSTTTITTNQTQSTTTPATSSSTTTTPTITPTYTNVTNFTNISTTTTAVPSPTFLPSIQFDRNFALDVILYVAAGFAIFSPHVPIAAFIVSRTAAVSRTITPLSLLEAATENETVSCASYGYLTSKYDGFTDVPLFFNAPIVGWSFASSDPIPSESSSTNVPLSSPTATKSPSSSSYTSNTYSSSMSTEEEPYCYGPLLANFVGNLLLGLGIPLFVYFINFLIQTSRFRALPSTFLEPAANGWTSRFLLIYFFGFLFPGCVSSTLIAAARCAQGFSGAIAAVVMFASCFWMYSVLFWRRRSEVFRFRKLTFKSAKKLSSWQLWIIYFCEPRGIWKWIHNKELQPEDDEKKNKNGGGENNKNTKRQQESSSPTTKMTMMTITRPQLSTNLPTITSPRKELIGAGGSTRASFINSHPTLSVFNKNKPSAAAENQNQSEPSSDDEGVENEKKKEKKDKNKKKKQEEDQSNDDEEESDQDEENNPEKHEKLSQMRYLVALPFFDMYAGKKDYAFILVELFARICMILGLVLSEAVPAEYSCYSMRGIYMFSSIVLCIAAFARSPYSNRLAFYAIVISSGFEVMTETLLIVDPFTGAEFGPPILMASVIISVILLCFSTQLYFWIAPRIWHDLEFLEYEIDPALPPPPAPPKTKNPPQQSPPLQKQEQEIDYDELLGTKPPQIPKIQEQKEEPLLLGSAPLLPPQNQSHDSDLDSLDNNVPIAPPPAINSQKKLEFSSDEENDEDEDPNIVGSSTGAATTVTSYAFHHSPKKEDTFDLFERLDRQVRKAFFELFHEDVHVLPRHQQLENAREDFEQLVDL